MRQKISKTGLLLDDIIRKACERIPQKKRKLVVLGLCFLFVTVFSIMLWNSFNNPAAQEILNIEHIKPLDLPQDSLIQNFKDVFHE